MQGMFHEHVQDCTVPMLHDEYRQEFELEFNFHPIDTDASY